MAGLTTLALKRAAAPLVIGMSALALLSACDNGPSAVRQQAAGTQMATANAPDHSNTGGDGAPQVDHRKDVVAQADDGKPMWAPSKRNSAEDGAQRAFERNGEAFGAKSIDQFVKKAHAFVGHPPKGTETLTRSNGDTLFYDAKDNIFAVANKAGAPRTMFKPDDGASYWQQQKDRQNEDGGKSRYAKRRSRDDSAE